MLDARGQIGGMDDGARFQMVSQLIQETIEHGKSILVNSSSDKREQDASSNSASVHSLLQQDRVIAAVGLLPLLVESKQDVDGEQVAALLYRAEM